MPANLPPQYFEAEKVYRQAKTPEEKVEALETMLAIMPKHKGTDKLRADLRRRIAKFSEEALRRPSAGRKGSAYNIRKEGAGQIVLVGLPNAGKSQLVSTLTDAFTTVADYPYATKEPLPGMMRFENIQIQLLDMPPITDREAKPWFSHLLRNADILLVMIDLADDPQAQMEAIFNELENMKIELRVAEGGDGEPVPGIARKKALIVGNKKDMDDSGRHYSVLSSRYGGEFPIVAVSATDSSSLDDMKHTVFKTLEIIRVYTKSPGQKPDFDDPIILT
jgi:ribosome-interacting GTPase 1